MNRICKTVALGMLVVAGGMAETSRAGGQFSWAIAVGSSSGMRHGGGHDMRGGMASGCAPRVFDRPACPPFGRPHWNAGYYPRVFVPPPVYAPVYCPTVVRYVAPPTVIVQEAAYVPPVETAWVQNSNGSRTPVQLRRADGGMYVGPKGEYYLGWPTDDQLRQAYGM